MKNTIRNSVNEVYDTNVNNIKSNPSLSENMLPRSIPKPKNINANSLIRNRAIRQNNNSSFLLFLLIFLMVSFVGAVFYFRDKISSYLNKFFDSSQEETKEKEETPKKEKEEQKIPEKENKNENKANYSKNQIVKEDDMYCYVGEDDNMRQCIEVFKDDVCTSGDIFNRIDQCLVPNTKM